MYEDYLNSESKYKMLSPPTFYLFLLARSSSNSMGKQRILFLILANYLAPVYSSTTFEFVNKCAFTVWPGILSNAGIAPLLTTGFSLQTGESNVIDAPSSWGGRFWGRTHCSVDSTGEFSCATGDCGSGKIECAGRGATPPATLAEFTLQGDAGILDFYDVSLVDGYNLPMLVVPQGASGANCTSIGCVGDFDESCPSELRVSSLGGEGIACKSACEAFGTDEYCCSGAYGSPQVCQPTQYSQIFKKACPHAYSYAYDDRTSTFTCTGGTDYVVTFCPSPNTSKKSSSDGQTLVSEFNSSMVYQGALDVSGSPTSTCARVLGGAIAAVVAVASHI
ncbi:thaumatin-like protein 1b isoform X2 [Primulina eburnea]|uniref:thaumatin-like protein 1b isoform X2 n=1 Tax=Primulina eburnea TaxID=1245227 RepID=UPI003C6C3533